MPTLRDLRASAFTEWERAVAWNWAADYVGLNELICQYLSLEGYELLQTNVRMGNMMVHKSQEFFAGCSLQKSWLQVALFSFLFMGLGGPPGVLADGPIPTPAPTALLGDTSELGGHEWIDNSSGYIDFSEISMGDP